jgi:uncharacterized protein YaaW (UPF0174 family)
MNAVTDDPLLTDDLAELLGLFPNQALREILNRLAKHKSWSPFPSSRATEAHQADPDADLRPHAAAIAREIVWWGSNDIAGRFKEPPPWREILLDLAKVAGVKKEKLAGASKAWEIEHAILGAAAASWESLTPEQRKQALEKAGLNKADYAKAVGGLVSGTAARAGVGPAAAMLGLKGAAVTAASAVIMPLTLALTAAWTGYVTAGPAYRVLKPVALAIALTRRQLIDARAAQAFEF